MQQDAHEFLNYLLNTIADLLQEEKKQDKQNGKLANGTLDSQKSNTPPPSSTWVHEIFQGTLTNETRCLTCETVTQPGLAQSGRGAVIDSNPLHFSENAFESMTPL